MLYITNFLLPLMGVLTALFLGAATYLTYQQMKGIKVHGSEPNPDYNPFFYGNPVSPDQSFIIMARGKIVRALVEQIKTGQSGAIIGAFSQERTLILKYIEERKEQLFGNQSYKFIFSFLDISALSKTTNQTQSIKVIVLMLPLAHFAKLSVSILIMSKPTYN
ncbi:MAG: hypothetical protein ABFS56_12245 [Pseudomonadota bacterium]